MELGTTLFVLGLILFTGLLSWLALRWYRTRPDESDEPELTIEETTWTVYDTPELRRYTVTFPDGSDEELIAFNHDINSEGILRFKEIDGYGSAYTPFNNYGMRGHSRKEETVTAKAKEHPKEYVARNVESIEWEDYPALEREITVRGQKRAKGDDTRWEATEVDEVLVG